MSTNRKEYQKEYRIKNRKEINEKRREWRKKHKEEINEKRRGNRSEESKIYYDNHKEEIKAYGKSEKGKGRRRKYYNNNAEEAKLYAKEYRQNNPEKVRIAKRNWARKARKENIQYKMKLTLRNRINKALSRISKTSSTFELLGCDIVTFMKYIESKFSEGMNWSNHGIHGWHIDHIKPCVSFDLTKPEEQEKCFHYTNLQPLWAEDNLSKGDFYNREVKP
jgi:hypothetical protein